MKNSESADLKNNANPPEPWQTTLTITIPAPRATIEALASAASEDSYGHAVEKRDTDEDYTLTFFHFADFDADMLRGKLMIMAEIMDIDMVLKTFKTAPCPDKNWLQEVHTSFPPQHIGSFFVYGSHYIDNPPEDVHLLNIDAATAFGSGDHGTTQLCLEALSSETHTPSNILDMGCGSGILAIAARKIWPSTPILGVDIDAESIRVAKHHTTLNDTPDITFLCGDGYDLSIVKTRAPYDYVIANILANPLIEMAPKAASVIAKNGYLILSGLLETQIDAVLKAHTDVGFKRVKQAVQNEWACLTLQKV